MKKIIVPAAGYGTRVRSEGSKELLPHPVTGLPLIDQVLDFSLAHQLPLHIITRHEKTDLIGYLQAKNMANLQVQQIQPSREWPDSVLQSAEFWSSHNVLVLPDTEFSPPETITHIFSQLDDFDLVAACFAAQDLSVFGAFEEREGGFYHAEKPRAWSGVAQAWGLLGFRPAAGLQIFKQMLDSTFDHEWRKVSGRAGLCHLTSFTDLTR